MPKTHAMILQLSNADGSSRQHMIGLPNANVWRRTVVNGQRTTWRSGSVADYTTWAESYVAIAADNPRAPLNADAGLVLIEVSDEEATEIAAGKFPAEVNDRFLRVIAAITDSPGTWPVTPRDQVKAWVERWLEAERSNENAWLDTHTHPDGTLTAAPRPATPKATPKVKANAFSWPYEPIVDGYVTRPNGEKYKVRMLEGRSDVERLREAREHGDHVFLPGDPGTGKTALVEAAFGVDLITMLGTESTEESDYVGSYVVAGKDEYVWTDGPQVQAMEKGKVFFVDEGCVIDPRTNVILYSGMDRRGAHQRGELLVKMNPARGLITALPGFIVVVATNPKAPGVRISEALLDRCSLTIEVGTDYDTMRALGVPAKAINVATSLLAKQKIGEVGYVPQARALLRFRDQVDHYGERMAIRNLVGSAPEGRDRKAMIETVKRVFGAEFTALSI